MEPTARLRRSSISMRTKRTLLPIKTDWSSIRTEDACDAGIKTVAVSVATRMPPRTVWLTTPSRISPAWWAATPFGSYTNVPLLYLGGSLTAHVALVIETGLSNFLGSDAL